MHKPGAAISQEGVPPALGNGTDESSSSSSMQQPHEGHVPGLVGADVHHTAAHDEESVPQSPLHESAAQPAFRDEEAPVLIGSGRMNRTCPTASALPRLGTSSPNLDPSLLRPQSQPQSFFGVPGDGLATRGQFSPLRQPAALNVGDTTSNVLTAQAYGSGLKRTRSPAGEGEEPCKRVQVKTEGGLVDGDLMHTPAISAAVGLSAEASATNAVAIDLLDTLEQVIKHNTSEALDGPDGACYEGLVKASRIASPHVESEPSSYMAPEVSSDVMHVIEASRPLPHHAADLQTSSRTVTTDNAMESAGLLNTSEVAGFDGIHPARVALIENGKDCIPWNLEAAGARSSLGGTGANIQPMSKPEVRLLSQPGDSTSPDVQQLRGDTPRLDSIHPARAALLESQDNEYGLPWNLEAAKDGSVSGTGANGQPLYAVAALSQSQLADTQAAPKPHAAHPYKAAAGRNRTARAAALAARTRWSAKPQKNLTALRRKILDDITTALVPQAKVNQRGCPEYKKIQGLLDNLMGGLRKIAKKGKGGASEQAKWSKAATKSSVPAKADSESVHEASTDTTSLRTQTRRDSGVVIDTSLPKESRLARADLYRAPGRVDAAYPDASRPDHYRPGIPAPLDATYSAPVAHAAYHRPVSAQSTRKETPQAHPAPPPATVVGLPLFYGYNAPLAPNYYAHAPNITPTSAYTSNMASYAYHQHRPSTQDQYRPQEQPPNEARARNLLEAGNTYDSSRLNRFESNYQTTYQDWHDYFSRPSHRGNIRPDTNSEGRRFLDYD
ncbi:hypothetical protein MBLNU230_g0530t1 [Neophaeotheca triangularis]